MADGGMFPINISPFVREIPRELIEARLVSPYH
jgi:hypothetical protein